MSYNIKKIPQRTLNYEILFYKKIKILFIIPLNLIIKFSYIKLKAIDFLPVF